MKQSIYPGIHLDRVKKHTKFLSEQPISWLRLKLQTSWKTANHYNVTFWKTMRQSQMAMKSPLTNTSPALGINMEIKYSVLV